MTITIYLDILLLLLFSFFLYYITSTRRSTKHPQSFAPTNWPLLGMIPAVLQNAHRLHDFATDIVNEAGGTFVLKGPWFANMDMVATADPANIHYILSKNFSNYPKGPEFRKIFDILGDGIFNSDAELWGIHRRTTMSLMNREEFHCLLERVLWCKVEKGLVPVVESVCENGKEVDLQEIFQRFTFDSICSLVLDHDPQSLSLDFPYIACEKAFTDAEEALLHRHILPQGFWKLQKWLQIGKEKILSKACVSFDQFIYHCISLKKNCGIKEQDEGGSDYFSLFKSIMKANEEEGGTSGDPNKFLRDTLLSLMLAGRDTTSTALTWFFYLLTENPSVEMKIREEIKSKLSLKTDEIHMFFKAEDLHKLVYLHGALCEALRLYPPVALEHKAPVEPDILPSGHRVDRKAKIVLCFYTTGRMETVWGKDCLEFKPERWISERSGGIKHEPSYKFPAFNAGPRTCIGKEMAFRQMKIVAATLINNYNVKVVQGHPITPSDSIILQMKHGFKDLIKLWVGYVSLREMKEHTNITDRPRNLFGDLILFQFIKLLQGTY